MGRRLIRLGAAGQRSPKLRSATGATVEHRPPATSLEEKSSALAGLPRLPFHSLQIRASNREAPAPREGLPPRLKAGIEALSGVSMDGVKIRYNSPHPARLDALAFARGREIHLAAGEERHLPHEAWHLAQQAQGRVKADARLGGVPLNEDDSLEREADVMGSRAAGLAPSARGAAVPKPTVADRLPSAGGLDAQPVQARGSRSRRRKRWQAVREGRPKPHVKRSEPELNLAPLGDKHVTVYRVEHDAKPAILSPSDERLKSSTGEKVPQAPVYSKVVTPRMRKPTQNLKTDEVPDAVHWVSLNTPARAIANWRQRVGNQLAAHDPKGGPRTLPADKMPKLKSFKIPSQVAKRIQQEAVLEHQAAASPGAPINSDQNYAPNQFGLNKDRFEAIARHAVKNSYMEYDQSDLATLQSIHGSGKSADDHHRKDEYPAELRKQLKVRRSRGSGKRNAQKWRQPDTYDRSKDPFERREDDRDLDPEARSYLWPNRRRTLADFFPQD